MHKRRRARDKGRTMTQNEDQRQRSGEMAEEMVQEDAFSCTISSTKPRHWEQRGLGRGGRMINRPLTLVITSLL